MSRVAAAALLALSCLASAPAPVAAAPRRLELPKRWFYASQNLLVDANATALLGLMDRAAKAGYTGLLLADSKFGRLAEMDARYFKNVERVKEKAKALALEIVPAVFPVGYSESILSQDENLAEALPVRDALFVVQAGGARLTPDPPLAWKGGDMTDLSQWDWKDDTVVSDAGTAKMSELRGRNGRLVQKVKLTPYRLYHLSVRVKTQDFRGEPRVQVLAGKRGLVFSSLGVKRTQDWTVHHAVFDSLDVTEASVYLGCWDGTTGTVWWDDANLEEVGLLNVVRRPGAPLVVRKEGGKELVEGKDFEPVRDPRMGTVPWKGGYEVWHEPPAIQTSLPEGTHLRVSFSSVVTVNDGQVAICPSEPKTLDVLRDQARRLHAAWKAKGYFMEHDEIRVLGWDDACAKRGLSCGQILAQNAKDCVKILSEVNPGGDVYVWSDMFDPNHNAHADYYLVKDDLAGSWEGLPKDVIVGVWHFGKRAESLKFFSSRGHRTLIAGYYDGDVARVADWLDAAKRVDGVVGVMYTTWRHAFDDLERFAEVVEKSR